MERPKSWHFGKWRAITDQVRGGVSTAQLLSREEGGARHAFGRVVLFRPWSIIVFLVGWESASDQMVLGELGFSFTERSCDIEAETGAPEGELTSYCRSCGRWVEVIRFDGQISMVGCLHPDGERVST